MSSSSVTQQQKQQQIIQSVGCTDEMTSLNLVQTKHNSSPSNSNNHTHTSSNSPRPELTTMTNVNVLDLQMNAHQPSVLSRNGDDDDHKKDSHIDNYEESESISNW